MRIMKKCNKCGNTKPRSEFQKSTRAKDGLQAWCRRCKQERHTEYYIEAKERVWKPAIARQISCYRDLVLEALSGGCVDCGLADIRCLEFDHSRGEKLFTIGAMRKRGLTAIRNELAKCDVRCANCHRIKTIERDPNWRLDHI